MLWKNAKKLRFCAKVKCIEHHQKVWEPLNKSTMPQKSHSSQIALDTLYNQMQNLEIIMVKVTQCELREQNESCNYTPWPCGNVRNRVDPVLLKSSDQGYTLYIFETFWENIRQISRFFEIMTKSVQNFFTVFTFLLA